MHRQLFVVSLNRDEGKSWEFKWYASILTKSFAFSVSTFRYPKSHMVYDICSLSSSDRMYIYIYIYLFSIGFENLHSTLST